MLKKLSLVLKMREKKHHLVHGDTKRAGRMSEPEQCLADSGPEYGGMQRTAGANSVVAWEACPRGLKRGGESVAREKRLEGLPDTD